MRRSRQFKLESKKASDYFRLLDIDGDNHISFSEFLAPLMNQIPPNVAVVFVSDIRFKMDIYKSLRNHYKIVSKITKAVTVDMIKGKIRELNDSLGDHQVQALESFRFETEEISEF